MSISYPLDVVNFYAHLRPTIRELYLTYCVKYNKLHLPNSFLRFN